MANDGRILIQATVIAIKDDQILYPSCKQCYSKLQREQYEKEWVCFKCSTVYEDSKLEWRYRLSITVAEKASLTDIALFGKTLEPYFGTSAERLHRFLEKIDEDNLMEENMLLNALEETFVGQSFIFGIKSNARLKELQRYHGPMSPVCASTVLKVRLGDYATQSSFNSDLVAVQILSSANVSFTGNTVLYNLQTLTNFNWEIKPLCSVVNSGCKSIQECSYLPYTTFDQSDSYSYLKDGTNSGIELSYEKSVESSNQTTFNETYLRDVNVGTKSSHEACLEQSCEITIDNSGHVSDRLASNLDSSLETPKQKIKSKNNRVSRLQLSNKLLLNVDPCLTTMEENGVDRTIVINAKQQNKDTGTYNPELNKQKQSLSNNNSESNSTRDTSHGQVSKLKESFPGLSTTIESGKKDIMRNSNDSKLTSVPNIHEESSVEVLRNYDQEIKAHYDPSYLSYSDWDNSFNFTGLNSNIASDCVNSSNTQKNASQVTIRDVPESENLEQFISDPSFLSVDCPESLQLGTSLKFPSDHKPNHFGKNLSNLSDKATMHPIFKKSTRSLDPLKGVSQNPQSFEKVPKNVCDMPESEDLSKFLDNDSFDAQIMTENFVDFDTQQQFDIPILEPKCDNSIICQPNLNNPHCDITKSRNTKIHPHCDNPKSHDAVLKLTKCDSKDHGAMLNNPHLYNAGGSDCSQTINCDQSTYLSFEACLKEIENCDLTSRSFVSSQILLDNESKKVKQTIINENSRVNEQSSFKNSNGLSDQNLDASVVCNKSNTDHVDTGNFGDDSLGSMCLFSDEEDVQVSFSPNPQDFRRKYGQDLDNVHISNFRTPDFGKDDPNSHGVSKIKDPNTGTCLNAETLEDFAADASTVLDLEIMRNTSVHFNPDILTESLFGDSISSCPNDISELLLGMDLKAVEVERRSYQFVIQKEDNTAEWGTDLENDDFLALDLCKVTSFNQNQTCESVLSIPPSKSQVDPRLANQKLNQTNSIKGKEFPVIKKANLDLDFDSVDDSEILAMDFNQNQFSGAPISPSKFDVPGIFMDTDQKSKNLHQNEDTVNDASTVLDLEVMRNTSKHFNPDILTESLFGDSISSSPNDISELLLGMDLKDVGGERRSYQNVSSGKGGAMSEVGDSAGSDLQETSHTPKPKILSKDLISNGVHENDLQQTRTHEDNDLNDSSNILDVTEDGSMDLFDCSQSFAASHSGAKSQPQSMLIVDNSVLDTSEPILNPAQNLCLSTRVKFARRLSTVRHINLVDIRLNMCQTSSPLTSAQNLKSCLRKPVQEAMTDLDESVFSQNVFSPSPVKPARDLRPAYICRPESSKQLCQEPGISCYNSTPVNSNRSTESSVFSPDLFSPG